MSLNHRVYVSPDARPSMEKGIPGSEGNPLPGIAMAIAHIRQLRSNDPRIGGVDVILRGGIYRTSDPIELCPADSDVHFIATDGEVPIIDGGVRITDWQMTRVGDRTAWRADVSSLLAQFGHFRSLFVNGERRSRPALPKSGWLRIESAPGVDPAKVHLFAGGDRFITAPSDIQAWKNLTDIDVVAAHFWVDERMPIASFDPETRLLTSTRHSIFTLTDAWEKKYARYRLENVAEALSEPGEWYLDRTDGTLTYLPVEGELPETAEVVVPILLQLARCMGEEGEPIRNVTFSGIVFRHTDWTMPQGFGLFYDPYRPRAAWRRRDSIANANGVSTDVYRPYDARREREFASMPQAALDVPGVIHFQHATGCRLENCTVRSAGWGAVSFYEGCTRNVVRRCVLHDLGAGGIIADGGGPDSPLARRTGQNAFIDNRIHGAGHIWASACGITCAFSGGNLIERNELYDLTYTGISVGWQWNFGAQVSRENRICDNHIYQLGRRGGLSDMGGIYTLGVQPGTIVARNHIHDITGASYGANGIYLDEGSSCIIVESNLIHDCTGNGISEHYGRDNRIIDNIIAFCGTARDSPHGPKGAAFAPCRERSPEAPWPPRRTLLLRNIFVGSNQRLIHDDSQHLLEDCHVDADLNLYWDYAESDLIVFDAEVAAYAAREGETVGTKNFDFNAWRSHGFDRHGKAADPCFRDVANRDFTLLPDSPAIELGFRPVGWNK